MDHTEALAWLDAHIDLERMRERPPVPSLDAMTGLVAMLGDPQLDQETIHVTGTNGKGSVVRFATSLLTAAGVVCGTTTSPHLHSLNERIRIADQPISDGDLAEVLTVVRMAEEAAGVSASWFEVMIAAAYRHFSDEAVGAAVVEVGMAGRWDATNVVDAAVAVATTVDVDHVEFLGADPVGIAREKAGIVGEGSTLVLGVTEPDLAEPFLAAGPAEALRTGVDFGADDVTLAVGGWTATLWTPRQRHPDVVIPFHGRHQVDNLVMALAAVEALIDQPISPEVLNDALEVARQPAVLEVADRQPLTIIDGAHNRQGLRALARTLRDEFAVSRRVPVVGMLGRDPSVLIEGLGISADHDDAVVVTEPTSGRAVPAAELAAAVEAAGVTAHVAPDVATALETALHLAGVEAAVVVCGSLYLAAEAREYLGLADR